MPGSERHLGGVAHRLSPAWGLRALVGGVALFLSVPGRVVRSETRRTTHDRFLPIGALLVGLLMAPSLKAYEPERDAWLEPEQPYAVRKGKPRDPLLFTAITATGNDREPLVARDREAELVQAAAHGDRARVEALLAEGVNPNRPSALRWGERALVHAVDRGDVEMVRILLEAGAHPDLRGNGFTPLGMAALRGHARIARLLLRAGADVDLKGADGNTPLFLAAWLDRAEVVRELLTYRPDFTLPNKGYTEPAPMFDSFLSTQRPHFYRPDERLNRYEGLNALGIAAMQGSTRSLALMLEAGADPRLKDRGDLEPLFYAIYRRQRAAAELLLARGADPGPLRVDF